MRVLAIVGMILAAGCSGSDPTTDKLEPGSIAVVVLPTKDDGSPESDRGESVFLHKSGGAKSTDYLPLSPGVRVTVGQDLGYLDRTQADIDRDIKDLEPSDSRSDEVFKAEKPARHYPPDPKARIRPVRVVVESGPQAGVAGTVDRENLRPVKR